ncbi:MAG: PAS domain S-box protein [Pyrinomonadaceae bacterium]
MPVPTTNLTPSTSGYRNARRLFAQHQLAIYTQTDRLFAYLMMAQWAAAIGLTVWLTPRTWSGGVSSIHPHVWAAIVLGGIITALPVGLAWRNPGAATTRYTIATAQMLMGALFIHLSGGRIETHFHIFGSLAFLAFYRDWKVLIPATLVVVLDHSLFGIFLPQSVYGTNLVSNWRTIEHAGWVLFEDIFLIYSCVRSQKDMWSTAVEVVQRSAGEKRYRSLLAAISQVVWTTDHDGRVSNDLPQWRSLTGQTVEQVRGFGWLEGIHEDDRQATAELWRNAIENKSPYQAEYRIRLANGEYGDFVSRGIPMIGGGGDIEEWVGICEDVTERKEAKRERDEVKAREHAALVQIQASENRYRQLADAMPQIVWTTMADGWVDYLNQQWSSYTGRDFAASSGWAWTESVHPDDLQICASTWKISLTQGTDYEVECRLRRAADGAFRWHICRAMPVRDETGQIVKWFGTCTDIDDQKRVEAELEETRAKLEDRVAKRTDELVQVNDGLCREILERQQAEAERRVLFEIIQGVTTTSNLRDLLQLIHRSIGSVVYAENCFVALADPATGMIGMEFFVDRFDQAPPPHKLGWGRSAYVFRTGQPILMTKGVADELIAAGEIDPIGTPPASWMGIPLISATKAIGVLVVQHYERPDAYSERDLALLTSVGSQIAFAIERKQVEERLRESEEKYRTILDTLDDGYFELDLKGNYVFVNDAFCRITGHCNDELVDRNYRDLFQGEIVQRLFDAYHNVYVTGQTLTAFEYEIFTSTGEKRFIEESVSLKRDAESKPTGFIGIRRDCSQRKQAEIELHEARNAALVSTQLKSEFLANMSHEIRTPMNGVIGMTGLLLNSSLTPSQRDFAETIQASGDSLLIIINDILDFSKIEAGKMEFEEIEFDVGSLVESTVELFAEPARRKNLELASLVHRDVPLKLKGDPNRLRQVLTNLIGNALKFTEFGEVVVHAEKAEETFNHVTVRFTVIDTGIGIPEEARQRLFQAFTQADGTTTRKYGGTGLGLAISKQLVELMGGGFNVQSRVGNGSKFSFTVRLIKTVGESSAPELQTVPDLAGIRVLIVDDNATNRKILGHQLTSKGIEFVEASSGEQALGILRRDTKFDLAILDLMMPHMNGFELARHIKIDHRFAALRLLLLTSFAAENVEPSRNRDDISAFMTKPVKQSQLIECLARLVRPESTGPGPTPSVSGESLVAKVASATRFPAGKRILIAEDNLVNQKVARLQLMRLGLRADLVNNGREAFEAMQLRPYDLILMDCQMPEMDGYKATEAIRLFEGKDRRTPVIAMTAHALEGDRAKCLAAGMDDYVSKPVKIEELGAALERYLNT